MLIKVPSKFTDDSSYIYPNMKKDIYVNTDLISTIEVKKYKEDITDNTSEAVVSEYELKYNVTIQMSNQNFITCKYGITDAEFQEFMVWFNRAFARARIRKIRDDF